VVGGPQTAKKVENFGTKRKRPGANLLYVRLEGGNGGCSNIPWQKRTQSRPVMRCGTTKNVRDQRVGRRRTAAKLKEGCNQPDTKKMVGNLTDITETLFGGGGRGLKGGANCGECSELRKLGPQERRAAG